MATRRIYLSDLNMKYTVAPYGNGKFVVKNEAHKGIVLTNPRVRISLIHGVFFEDFDATGEFTSDAIYTRNSYNRIGPGHKGRRP